jgi:hypothetical protein
MDQDSPDCVDLAAACKVLVKSSAVQALVKKKVGAKNLTAALELMQAGKLDGPLGDKLHDFLADTIENKSADVWSGLIPQEGDEYPVQVKEYQGIYWVWAMEYDPIGYFLDQASAEAFVRSNWDDVYEEGEELDEDEDNEEVLCPYCHTSENCDHLLLMVDRTFRHAEGGLLYKAFNSRWADIMEKADDPDFEEREPFDELLDEVDSLSDAELTSSPDSAPGMSATFSFYFCSSKKKAMAAAKKFSKA